MKQFTRYIGFSLIGLGITLTLFEFLLEHSEWVFGAGLILLVVSLLIKDQKYF